MRKKEEMRTGKSKMTVMMFQLEGDDTTLQEGFRTISQAMTSVLKPVYALPATAASGDQALAPGNGHAVGPEDTTQTEPQGESTEAGIGRTTRSQRSHKSPEIIKDLDLLNGKTSLKDFLSQKSVGENDNKRCLAIAVWLKENRSITEVTGDHVFTCYRHMGWGTPNDVLAPIRGLKAKGAFSKGKGPKSYAINHIGENRVLKMGATS